ncbi:MAG: AmmeMemoRadiSam system protein B [Gammaproteobacteria bacterium]
MAVVQAPVVAGMFYPGDPEQLRADVLSYLDAVQAPDQAIDQDDAPKAMIVPHAGYQYSGPVAASAYARLLPVSDRIERVVLMGPSHRVALHGIAASGADFFETPLGRIPVDREALARLQGLGNVGRADVAFAREHSLEVHLPFLQTVLGGFSLVPFVVGQAEEDEVAAVLEALWGGPETLIVISSDLSHYHDYTTCQGLDAETTRRIVALEGRSLTGHDACGVYPVRGLLRAARRLGLTASVADVRNSGDTAGPRDRVVGYGSYLFH